MQTFLKSMLGLITLPLLAGCQALFFGAVNRGDGAINPVTEVYSVEHQLSLDVYRPPHAKGPLPVALFFYGGSWRMGDRHEYEFVGRELASRGVLAIVADYRKFPAGKFPLFEQDAADAARWTRDNAARLGGDPKRLFVVGHSAGAHIAILLASDARYLAAVGMTPKDFAGAIGLAGPYDFLPLTDPKIKAVFGPEKDWPASQPINFVDGDEPTTLLLQGTGDRIVAPRNARVMAEKLRSVGVSVVYKTYPGVGHFRILAAFRYHSLAPTLDDVISFIDSTPPLQ